MTPDLPDSIPNPNLGLDQYFYLAINLFEFILIVAAFISIVYSGVMMITANGDTAKFSAGKKNLIWSVIGLIVAVMAYFLILAIYQSFSGNPLQLQPPAP